MRKIINIILYAITIVFLVMTAIKNPYLNDLYNKKVITDNKTYTKYYNSSRFVCIDLKNAKMTRFKEKDSDSIVYVTKISNNNFLTILTSGTSTSDKVCGLIKNSDSMSKELRKSIEDENKIELSSRYFTNNNINSERIIYIVVLVSICVLLISLVLGIIANIISLIRKEF